MLRPSRPPLLPLILFTAIFMAVLIANAKYWWPFFSDDALISLRYADRLLEGKGLNWNDAPPNVEGYSNLLWTLLVALMGYVRIDLIFASRLLGVACMGLVIASISWWQLGRSCPRASVISLGAGLLFFSLAAPTGIWAIGGLEQPLIAALLALAIPLTFRLIDHKDDEESGEAEGPPASPAQRRTLWLLSLVLGLLCITRPDGPIFSVAAFFAILIGRWANRRPTLDASDLVLRLPVIPVLLYGGQLAFRLAYYGEWVPNTALVKIGPRGVYLERGVEYIISGFSSLMPYSATAVLSILACLFVPARRGRALALLLFTLFWLPYVAYVGGDIHPGHRHLVPFVVVLTFALVDGIDLLLSWSESRSASALLASGKRLIRIAAPVGLFVAAFPFLVIQTSHPDNLQVHEETWVWNGEVTGRLLKKAFGESQPVVAVTAAGCIPYWSELPALDMLGLNDHYLPRHPPETFGEGYLGHELGDGQYVLDQAPDIICFHTGIYEGIFRSGGELQQMDEFYERYAPIRLLGRHPKEFTATVWLLRSSPKVGIHPSDTAIRIPGYLFQSDQDAPAFLGESGRLVQPLAPGRSVRIVLQTAEGADWDVDEAGISMHAGLRASVEKTEDGSAIVLSNEGAAAVELESVTLKRS